MHVYVVCLTILLCVFMVCKLKINIGITVKHEYEHERDTIEPIEDDSEEYENIEENTISTDEILNAFNDLFGGIDDE